MTIIEKKAVAEMAYALLKQLMRWYSG